MAGRMTKKASEKRQEQEAAVFALVTALTRLEMVQLRVRQALRRSGLIDLLQPAVEQLEKLGREIEEAKDYVANGYKGE